MKETCMQEQAGPQSVELVRNMSADEWKHSAYILHAGHLGAQCCLGVEVSINEVTKFFSPDLTFAMDPNAAGPGNSLTSHMAWSWRQLGNTQTKILIRLWHRGYMADRPRGYVIMPGVPVAGLGCCTVLGILATYRSGHSSVWSWVAWCPLMKC